MVYLKDVLEKLLGGVSILSVLNQKTAIYRGIFPTYCCNQNRPIELIVHKNNRCSHARSRSGKVALFLFLKFFGR